MHDRQALTQLTLQSKYVAALAAIYEEHLDVSLLNKMHIMKIIPVQNLFYLSFASTLSQELFLSRRSLSNYT